MKKLVICLLVLVSDLACAQVSLGDRLLLTCRVWGYLKYFHPKPRACQIKWDSVLTANIPAIKASTSNLAFNNALQNFFSAAGAVPMPSTPNPVVSPGYDTNLDLTWFSDPVFTASIKEQLDTIQRRFRPGTTCKVSYLNGGIKFSDQLEGMLNGGLPTNPQRFLVAFRYWNYIEYFFNSRNLTDVPWHQSLNRIALQLDTASTELSYQLSILELISAIDDSHAESATSPILTTHFGWHMPPCIILPVEKKPVVTKVLPGAIGKVKVGDVVTHVNGVPVDTLFNQRRRYTSGSNPNVLLKDLMIGFKNIFRGPAYSALTLQLSDENGSYTTTLTRDLTTSTHYDSSEYVGPSYKTINMPDCSFGYVNMGKIMPEELDSMYAALKDKSSIVIDMRDYPNGTADKICKMMATTSYTFAHLLRPSIVFPGVLSIVLVSYVNPYNVHPYQGNVYVLVNEFSLSQSEFSTMSFQGLGSKVKVIGSQTAGADGNVSSITLPGSISSKFSTLQVRYPDNYNTQRVGVRIDHTVTPTILGVKNGKDEVLEYALDLIGCYNTGMKEAGSELASLYPNPADNYLFIGMPASFKGKLRIYNSHGLLINEQVVTEWDSLKFALQVGNLPNGFYFIEAGGAVKKFIISRAN